MSLSSSRKKNLGNTDSQRDTPDQSNCTVSIWDRGRYPQISGFSVEGLSPLLYFAPKHWILHNQAANFLTVNQTLGSFPNVFASLFFLPLLLVMITITFSEGREFLVGGNTNSWTVPSPSSATLNQWAESTRFQVGDSLVWKYEGKKDSVLQVSLADYLSCNTTNPIMEYKEGSTTVELGRSGPFYFISGANGACGKGEKVAVVVMAERRHGFVGGMMLSPAPSPVEFDGPAVAPTSGAAWEMRRGFVGVMMVWLGIVGVMVVLC